MTTTATAPDTHLGVTQPRAMISEWIKLRSLRSTWWSIGIALLISVGLGILFSDLRGNDIAKHGGFEADPTAVSLRGFYLAQLAVGVLGVLFITGEYSTGMIRATLSAVPRRVPVWVAKIAVFAGAIFAITVVAAFVAFLGGQAVLSTYHVQSGFIVGPKGGIVVTQGAGAMHSLGVSISQPGALRAIFGAALYMTGVGLLGLGCGFILRNTGAAIAAVFGLLLVLPLLAQALPSSEQQHVTKFLPLPAGTAGMTTQASPDQLSPWTGLGVFAIYVVAALGNRAGCAPASRCVSTSRDTEQMSWVRRARESSGRRGRGGELHTEQQRERLTELAVSAERVRIAREMHDIVAHNLSVMIALTDGAALTVERDPARAREAIHQAAETGRAALAEMRDTVALLRSGPEDADPKLHPEPTLADLDALLETARSTGLQVTYQISGSTEGLSTGLQLALFRLVQEGVTNTLKHAPRATRLHVSIRRGQEDLRVVVDDDGGGGSPATAVGHGLIGMRERVALHNGRIFTGPTNSGWRVSAWLPLREQQRNGGRR